MAQEAKAASSSPKLLDVAEDATHSEYTLILHPEKQSGVEKAGERIRAKVLSTVYAIPSPAKDFGIFSVTPVQRQTLHYELTFLSQHALRVRFGYTDRPAGAPAFDNDPIFPSPSVQEWLSVKSPPGADCESGYALPCGFETNQDGFIAWVYPRHQGWIECRFVPDQDGNMRLEAYRSQTKDSAETAVVDPLWKQCTRGPFSHASWPSGLCLQGNMNGVFELIELQAGENLNVRFDEDRALFLYSDRGWGCLVRNPRPIKVDWLSRLKGPQPLLSISTNDTYLEYVVVVGEALDKMKEEYVPITAN